MTSRFSHILLSLRKERRLTQKQAAADLGVSPALLSHYEKGVRECGLSFVVRAADYYHVTCDYLLGRTADRSGMAPELASANGDPTDERQRQVLQAVHLLYAALNATGREELTDEVTNALSVQVITLLRQIVSKADAAQAAASLAAIARASARISSMTGSAAPAVSAEDLRRSYPYFAAALDRMARQADEAVNAVK
ncbi:MAG: helix-turn-helix domain-containing protein [Acutalibacteraceae bacterium]|jgi:transcriptional regulator with XRE-family HTH domain